MDVVSIFGWCINFLCYAYFPTHLSDFGHNVPTPPFENTFSSHWLKPVVPDVNYLGKEGKFHVKWKLECCLQCQLSYSLKSNGKMLRNKCEVYILACPMSIFSPDARAHPVWNQHGSVYTPTPSDGFLHISPLFFNFNFTESAIMALLRQCHDISYNVDGGLLWFPLCLANVALWVSYLEKRGIAGFCNAKHWC